MRKNIVLALALAGAVSLSACETPQQQRGTVVGGAVGAGTGAIIGSAITGGSPGGALAGAAIGAGTGAVVGNRVTRPHHCARWGFDRHGNRVCLAFH